MSGKLANKRLQKGILTDELLANQLDLEKLLAFNTGAYLTGLTLKRDEEGWFIIIRATMNNKPVVHFTGVRHYIDIWEIVCYEVTHNQINWRPDKYA